MKERNIVLEITTESSAFERVKVRVYKSKKMDHKYEPYLPDIYNSPLANGGICNVQCVMGAPPAGSGGLCVWRDLSGGEYQQVSSTLWPFVVSTAVDENQ